MPSIPKNIARELHPERYFFPQLEILNLSVDICKTSYLIETGYRCLSVGIILLLLLYFVTNFFKRGYEGFISGFLGVVHDGNLLVAY